MQIIVPVPISLSWSGSSKFNEHDGQALGEGDAGGGYGGSENRKSSCVTVPIHTCHSPQNNSGASRPTVHWSPPALSFGPAAAKSSAMRYVLLAAAVVLLAGTPAL